MNKCKQDVNWLYRKLSKQISIYAGKGDGGLATLQDLYHKLKNNDKIVCESCGHRIDGGGRHKADCKIVEDYQEVFK